MKQNATYLKITIHDNDFIISLMYIGELLYELFQNTYSYPTEEHLPYLKEYIKHLWWSTNAITGLMRWGVEYIKEKGVCHIDYFEPTLEFVDYLDIPDWDNSESIYIPMFEDANVIVK